MVKRIVDIIGLCLFTAILSGCALPPSQSVVAPLSVVLPKLSVQLHSVKDDVANNFKPTLTQLADMGFAGVEFAGRYGPYQDDPEGLRTFLDAINLQVSGAHINLEQLQGAQGARNLAFFKELGTTLIIIPHDKRIDDPNEIDELIQELIVTSARTNAMGMRLGYHNHAKEFAPFKNATFWDYLAANTPEEFVLQLDIGWANFANVNPIDYIKRYPNRTLTTHLKVRTYQGKPGPVPSDSKVILGQDDFDWKSAVDANIKYGATQWLVIEQEEYPQKMTPLEAVHASLKGMQKAMKMNTGQ